MFSDENQFASAGEDGTVRLWDLRASKTPRGLLEPHKQSTLERPSLGKWVGCVNVDKEWLVSSFTAGSMQFSFFFLLFKVCGGGVSAGLWHIPSMQLTSSYSTEECGIHVALIIEERVFIGTKFMGYLAVVGITVRSCSLCSACKNIRRKI